MIIAYSILISFSFAAIVSETLINNEFGYYRNKDITVDRNIKVILFTVLIFPFIYTGFDIIPSFFKVIVFPIVILIVSINIFNYWSNKL